VSPAGERSEAVILTTLKRDNRWDAWYLLFGYETPETMTKPKPKFF
jgi:hypothetical protein